MYPGRNSNKIRSKKLERILKEETSEMIKFPVNVSGPTQIIEDEFSQSVISKVQSYLEHNLETEPELSFEDFFSLLEEDKPVTIVVNGQIGTIIGDEKDFVKNFGKPDNNYLYKLGKYKNTEVYVNAFFRWDDLSIFAFDYPFYDISDYTFGVEYNNGTFSTRRDMTYDLYFEKDLKSFIKKYKIESDEA